MIHVIYHKNCMDGFCAAYIYHRYLEDAGYTDIKYHPLQYDTPLAECGFNTDIKLGDTVVMLDVTFPTLDDMVELDRRAEGRFKVYDHHKTAIHQYWMESWFNYDTAKSTALMMIEKCGERSPRVIGLAEHVSDRDLWQFKLPNTKAVNAALSAYPMDFEVWDTFYVNALIDQGIILLRYVQQQITKVMENAFWFNKVAIAVNSSLHQSELGNQLLDKYPEAQYAIIYFDLENKTIYSLRSREGSAIDVSEIAKANGGGGHKHAAGFTITKSNVPTGLQRVLPTNASQEKV